MLVIAGPIDELPLDECRAIGDGRAVVVRTDRGVVAFPNRCLHQDSPLVGGWVRSGVLTCPLHFWRYRVDDGSLVGGGVGDGLACLPVTIVEGEVRVDVPGDAPASSLRDQLLARARTYDRSTEFARESERHR